MDSSANYWMYGNGSWTQLKGYLFQFNGSYLKWYESRKWRIALLPVVFQIFFNFSSSSSFFMCMFFIFFLWHFYCFLDLIGAFKDGRRNELHGIVSSWALLNHCQSRKYKKQNSRPPNSFVKFWSRKKENNFIKTCYIHMRYDFHH